MASGKKATASMEVKGAREAPFIGWADALGIRATPRRCRRREVEADSAESCPRTRKGMTLTCGPHAAVEGRESEAERAGLPVGLGKEKEKGRCGLKTCRGKRKGFPFS